MDGRRGIIVTWGSVLLVLALAASCALAGPTDVASTSTPTPAVSSVPTAAPPIPARILPTPSATLVQLPSPSPDSGTLRVLVEELIFPGTYDPKNPPHPTPHPFTQFPIFVRVTLAGQVHHVVAEGMTDRQAIVEFQLPPGDYWVYLPLDGPQRLTQLIGPQETMPDGTLDFAWKEVRIAARQSVNITLVYDYPAA